MPYVEALNNVTGKVSLLNSTTTLLNAGATFTGEWEDVSAYSDLSVGVKTDQDGTFTIQYSPDGVNADSTLTRYYRTGQIEAPHVFKNARQYARVTFTNTSASNQTYLRLQTIYNVNRGQLNAPTDSVLAQDYDANVVRPTNFNYEVALSRRQGYTTWNKFGYNADVDIGTETIWAYGGSFARMTAADTLNLVSSSADDDGSPAGTGARSVIIYGIDEDYLYQTEVVTMNGTTPVTTTNQWLGVNRVSVYLAGSAEGNVGNITISRTTGGSVQGYMPAGGGTTQQAFFFVQDNHTMLLDSWYASVVKNSGGTQPQIIIKCWVTSLVSGAKYEVFRDYINCDIENHSDVKPSQPLIIGEKSLLEFQCTTTVNNTEISCRFSGVEVRNVDA